MLDYGDEIGPFDVQFWNQIVTMFTFKNVYNYNYVNKLILKRFSHLSPIEKEGNDFLKDTL